MILSDASWVSGLIFSALMLLIICISFSFSRKAPDIKQMRVILLCCVLALLRNVLVVEFSFTITLEDWYVLPLVQDFFEFQILNLTVGGWFVRISLLGSLCLFLYKSYFYIKVKRALRKAPRLLDQEILEKIEGYVKERGKNFRIHAVYSDSLSIPMVFGLSRKYLVIPRKLKEAPYLDYILRHELEHFFHRDLWLKAMADSLQILFWWNPLVHFFRRQMTNALEIHNDLKIMELTDDNEKITYAKALLNTAVLTSEKNKYQGFALIHKPDKVLKKRFQAILQTSVEKPFVRKLSTGIILLLFILSFCFVIEPCSVTAEVEESTFTLEYHDEMYLLKKDGYYYLYIDGKCMGGSKEIPDVLSDVEVREEDEDEETKIP